MDVVSTYIFLRTSLFFILLVTGYNLSKREGLSSKNYWIIASISIIAYSLIEGLRYDRGTDYMHYKRLFEYSLNLQAYWESDKIEPLFQIFNKFFWVSFAKVYSVVGF